MSKAGNIMLDHSEIANPIIARFPADAAACLGAPDELEWVREDAKLTGSERD